MTYCVTSGLAQKGKKPSNFVARVGALSNSNDVF